MVHIVCKIFWGSEVFGNYFKVGRHLTIDYIQYGDDLGLMVDQTKLDWVGVKCQEIKSYDVWSFIILVIYLFAFCLGRCPIILIWNMFDSYDLSCNCQQHMSKQEWKGMVMLSTAMPLPPLLNP